VREVAPPLARQLGVIAEICTKEHAKGCCKYLLLFNLIWQSNCATQKSLVLSMKPRIVAQPDLFGGVLLVKEWGRIGAQGRMVAELYESEALAAIALQRQAERKRRRGYAD
jgi:predicted DNA-binding WGR domain protein